MNLRCPELDSHAELSPTERRRAARFATVELQRRYTAAHVGLRRVLGRRLQIPAADVRIVRGTFGKPALAPHVSTLDLRFNISHSVDIALVALTVGVDVGVDVEWFAQDFCARDITTTALSSRESAELASLPEPARNRAFLRLWVRKESILKAVGIGLAAPLPAIDVWSTQADTSGSITWPPGGPRGMLVEWQDVALEGIPAICTVAACGVSGATYHLEPWVGATS